MRLQKEVGGEEIQYGALGFNDKSAKMTQGLEIWFIGDLSDACQADPQDCGTPGIWFLRSTGHATPNKILVMPVPEEVSCETVVDAYQCAFLRKDACSSLDGFQPPDAINSETFKWRQVWNAKLFGDIRYHLSGKGPALGNMVDLNLASAGGSDPTAPPTNPPTNPPQAAPTPGIPETKASDIKGLYKEVTESAKTHQMGGTRIRETDGQFNKTIALGLLQMVESGDTSMFELAEIYQRTFGDFADDDIGQTVVKNVLLALNPALNNMAETFSSQAPYSQKGGKWYFIIGTEQYHLRELAADVEDDGETLIPAYYFYPYYDPLLTCAPPPHQFVRPPPVS